MTDKTGEGRAHPGPQIDAQPASGLSTHAGDFRIADRVTLRVAGAGNGSVQLLLAGDPKPIDVSEGELASLLEEKYFNRD